MVRHLAARWPVAAAAAVAAMVVLVTPVHADESLDERAPEMPAPVEPIVAVGAPPVPSAPVEPVEPVVAVGLPPVPSTPVEPVEPVVAVGLPPVPPDVAVADDADEAVSTSTAAESSSSGTPSPPSVSAAQESTSLNADRAVSALVSPSAVPADAPHLSARARLVTLLAGRHVLDHCR